MKPAQFQPQDGKRVSPLEHAAISTGKQIYQQRWVGSIWRESLSNASNGKEGPPSESLSVLGQSKQICSSEQANRCNKHSGEELSCY